MKLNKRDSVTFKFKKMVSYLFKDIIKLELCTFCYLYKSDCIPHALKVLMPSNESIHRYETCNRNYQKYINIPMYKIIVVFW